MKNKYSHFQRRALGAFMAFSLLALSGCEAPFQLGSSTAKGLVGPLSPTQQRASSLKADPNSSFKQPGDPVSNGQAGATGILIGQQAVQQLPSYRVRSAGLSPSQAKQLAAVFGLQDLKLEADGSVNYLNPERFQYLPTQSQPDLKTFPQADSQQDFSEDPEKTEAAYFDFEQLKALKVLEPEVALDRILIGLNKAGLSPQGKPQFGHAEFEARSVNGQELLKTRLDTQVSFEQQLGNYPLMGPGAKVKAVLDGEGQLTQLVYAQRELTQGDLHSLRPLNEVAQQAESFLKQQQPGAAQAEWKLSSVQLVYYAPPLEMPVKEIFPHYYVQGSLIQQGQTLETRGLLLPAVQHLQVKLDLQLDKAQAKGQAQVSGGTPPYQYSWSSATTPLDTALQGPEIAYGLKPRTATTQETLYLKVTDANGLTGMALASQQLDLQSTQLNTDFSSGQFKTQAAGRFDAGSEWVGLSQGLGGSRDNVGGFVQKFRDHGYPVQFNFGDFAAWEEDFKQVSMGGNDDNYVDDVDMVFYTGHANGDLFTFPGARDDGALVYTEAAYGEKELEWLVIAACGPLQRESGGLHLFERWGTRFKGLHLLMGYATVSNDNTIEGRKLGGFLLDEHLTMRLAWAKTAAAAQPSSVIYAYMGVIGAGGLSNSNDHYWGHGTVGPDIRTITGYWSVHAPS